MKIYALLNKVSLEMSLKIITLEGIDYIVREDKVYIRLPDFNKVAFTIRPESKTLTGTLWELNEVSGKLTKMDFGRYDWKPGNIRVFIEDASFIIIYINDATSVVYELGNNELLPILGFSVIPGSKGHILQKIV